MGRGQISQEIILLVKNFGFYSKCNGKSLKCIEQIDMNNNYEETLECLCRVYLRYTCDLKRKEENGW